MAHEQKVLTVPSKELSENYNKRRFFYSSDLSDFWSCVKKQGRFIDREFAETTEDLKQLVGCAVITNGPKILCARRTRKTNRKALALRWTIIFGGHVDDGDADSGDPITNCVIRELDEELGIRPVEKPKVLGLAVDPATKVGRLHLGVVHLVHSRLENVQLHKGLDTAEFVNQRSRQTLEFRDSDALLAMLSARLFDPWSELLLSSVLDRNAKRPNGLTQREFDLTWST